MSEAEALDQAHEDNLLHAQRARHRLVRNVSQLERIGSRLVHSGERKLKAGLIVLATIGGAIGGVLIGLFISIVRREG